jgi:hypothetical protein
MGQVERIPTGAARRGWTCTAVVRLGQENTLTRQIREHTAKRFERDPTQCGHQACYRVLDQPRCLNHAGQDALKILLGELV